MITLDLKKSNNQDIIQGKLILNISTNVNVPIRNGTNTLAASSRGSLASSSTAASTQPVTRLPEEPVIPSQQPPPHSAPLSSSVAATADEDGNSRNLGLPEG
jgi:E3 ubiquitin-protein ligase NEDD4